MIRLSLFAAAVCASVPCAADWQYAKFGMTPEEIIAASAGKAALGEAPDHDSKREGVVSSKVLATSEYAVKRFVFGVYFGFEPAARRLQNVDLWLRNGAMCRELLVELRATYGPPNTSDPGPILSIYTWRSESTNNHVQLTDVGREHCSVRYEPLARPTGGGL